MCQKGTDNVRRWCTVAVYVTATITLLTLVAVARAGANASNVEPAMGLSLTVIPQIIKAHLGEPMAVTLILKNTAPRSVAFLQSHVPEIDYNFEVVDQDGVKVPQLPPHQAILSNPNGGIAANGESRISVRLDKIVHFERPGTFTMVVTTAFQVATSRARLSLTSKPVRIIVLP